MRLLICDDHAVFAEALSLVLADAGHYVVAVTDRPDGALTVLRTEPVDICLLDVSFPSGSVLDRLAELRAAAPEVAIVLLTALAEPEVVAAGLATGVRGLAHKGQRVDEIVTVIDRVAAGEVVVAPTLARAAKGRRADLSDTELLAGFLTRREREVLSHLVLGRSTAVLAKALGVSVTTARSHIQSVLTKLGVHSQLEAVTAAVRGGLVSIETGEWLSP